MDWSNLNILSNKNGTYITNGYVVFVLLTYQFCGQ